MIPGGEGGWAAMVSPGPYPVTLSARTAVQYMWGCTEAAIESSISRMA